MMENELFLLEGIIQANQDSSEWCMGYVGRAMALGIVTREQAEHLLFNVIRVDGYWRQRFDRMFPEED